MMKKNIIANWNQYIVVFFFLFVILAPAIQSVFPFVSYGKLVRDFNEKRELTQAPKINMDSLDVLPAQINSYVNDNFEFRKWLIAWNNYIKVKKFKISPVKDVILGSGDWMFFASSGYVKNIESKALFSQAELEKFKLNLEEKSRYLESMGCTFYLAIAPDKSTIYPEYLPYYIHANSNSRTDQLISYLKNNSSVKVIDLKGELLKDKNNNQLYQKTDSHWNNNGSFLAYQTILETFKKDFKQLDIYTKMDFNITSDTVQNGGDLSGMLALRNEYTTINFTYFPKEYVRKTSNSHLPEYYTYDQSYKATTLVESTDTTLPRFMNFHDSFTGYLWDFIPRHFSRSVFLWTFEFRKDLIEKEKPDIVLYTILERDIQVLTE